jgi:small-conductance mechanosensitive channel
VAYGSDVAKVLKILDEATSGHPDVAKDPPHRIWFEAFGESSLDFEVWIFCAIDQGKRVATEIRTTIARRFAEEGIEIPFPQRDLHVRSVETPDMFGAMLERRPTER